MKKMITHYSDSCIQGAGLAHFISNNSTSCMSQLLLRDSQSLKTPGSLLKLNFSEKYPKEKTLNKTLGRMFHRFSFRIFNTKPVRRPPGHGNRLVRTILHCMTWHGMAWHNMVWYGITWYGMVWYGMGSWYGMAWHGMA